MSSTVHHITSGKSSLIVRGLGLCHTTHAVAGLWIAVKDSCKNWIEVNAEQSSGLPSLGCEALPARLVIYIR